jgi:hypothetical protein
LSTEEAVVVAVAEEVVGVEVVDLAVVKAAVMVVVMEEG